MKTFSIIWRNCNPDDFEYLNNTVSFMEVKEFDIAGWRDFSTGKKILDPRDVLVFRVNSEEETAMRLRFGDKIHQLV